MSSLRVLIVDSAAEVRKACCELGARLGYRLQAVESLEAAETILQTDAVDLLLLDLDLKQAQGLQQLEGLRTGHPEMAVVIAAAAATVDVAVQALRFGASDFLCIPLAIDELASVLDRAARRKLKDAQTRALQGKLFLDTHGHAIVGRSPSMEKLLRIVSKVAFSNHPVLIVGESGTGKELVARTIHNNGPHAGRPFVPVHCGLLTGESMERKLFGFAKGAFPEARAARAGLLVEADSGTVFFHGVNELSLDVQAKLVRVLQERAVHPLGAKDPVPIHARIIASAGDDLRKMQEDGRFRRDLYFRLNVVNVRVPCLAERREDIPLLADHILRRIRQQTEIPYELGSDVLAMLQAYSWPGNVRELEGALERACVMASSPFLAATDFPSQMQQESYTQVVSENGHSVALPGSMKVTSIAELEKNAILSTIQQLGGDKLKAARLLGIGKTTLYRKLKEYGIDIPDLN